MSAELASGHNPGVLFGMSSRSSCGLSDVGGEAPLPALTRLDGGRSRMAGSLDMAPRCANLEESQQLTWPHCVHIRRCTHRAPTSTHCGHSRLRRWWSPLAASSSAGYEDRESVDHLVTQTHRSQTSLWEYPISFRCTHCPSSPCTRPLRWLHCCLRGGLPQPK